jgi:hypothetical protein
MNMKKMTKILALAATLSLATAGVALATPSTQIWIPSTDIQPFAVGHLNLDSYIRTSHNTSGTNGQNTYVVGPTVGVLPFEKIQMEVGVDAIFNGTDYDHYPVYFHTKLGTPEDSLFKYSPALAVGIYNVGTNWDPKKSATRTDQNISYALAAKTLPVIGRLSAGYYMGNNAVLKDENGANDADGVLLSWDRTITEVSDKLWAAVDYQGGDNALGSVNFGVAWNFAKNVSVILGYDIYTKRATGGSNTATVQVDINFP